MPPPLVNSKNVGYLSEEERRRGGGSKTSKI